MKKKLISMMLTAVMAASLCACGGDDPAASGTDNKQSTGSDAQAQEIGRASCRERV